MDSIGRKIELLLDTVSEQLVNKNVGVMAFRAILDKKIDLLFVRQLTSIFDLELLG